MKQAFKKTWAVLTKERGHGGFISGIVRSLLGMIVLMGMLFVFNIILMCISRAFH